MRVLLSLLASAAFAFALSGCDPGIHVAYERDFRGKVDFDCIEKALNGVAPDVRRGSYVSDGNRIRGFGSGLIVTQFNYSDPSLLGGYSLDVAVQSSGLTHYWHEWGKIWTKIPPDEQRQVIPLLVRANQAIEKQCGLPFADQQPTIGNG